MFLNSGSRKDQGSVFFDEHGVTRRLSNGGIEQVAWKDLEELAIITTNDGPFVEDFFIVLHGRNGSGCVVPLGQAVSSHLVERLQSLPGFDNSKLIEASSHKGNAQWICWRADKREPDRK
jgi:hypothetical protein